MDKINSNVIDFNPAEGPSGPSIGQVYIDTDGVMRRGVFAGQSKASFEAIRAANNEEFAASGFVHFGKHVADSASYTPINEGALVNDGAPFYSSAGMIILGELTSSKDGKSKTDHPVLNIAGVRFDVLGVASDATKNSVRVKFPQAPDGKTTYHKSTGEIKVHVDAAAAFLYAGQSDNIEVVTDRVDMWGFESWLEEVTVGNPYIYPNGLIQSQSTTMDGFPTSRSNRPDSYYAVFDGDTGSAGRGVSIANMSFVQLANHLGNHKNNMYYLEDGRLVQWRLRQRTIAGAGNGDWKTIDSIYSDGVFGTNTNSRFLAQGMSESITSIGNDGIGTGYLGYAHASKTLNQDVGLFSGRHQSLSAISGECYFLVCGTVNRLNQGAYHPSFNPSGAATLSQIGGNVWQWHQLPSHITSTLSCFTPATSSTVGHRGGSIAEGNVLAGRPDGRYYDAIYADGFGGGCRDMRYSAYGLTPTDFADADQRVKNGTYRGFEKAVFTKVLQTASYTFADVELTIRQVKVSKQDRDFLVYSTIYNIYLLRPDGVLEGPFISALATGTEQYVNLVSKYPKTLSGESGGGGHLIVTTSSEQSIGGSFLQTDVIGTPANILATPQLANGWRGSWIPDVTYGNKLLTRKSLSSGVIPVAFTSNNGSSWVVGSQGLNGVTNQLDPINAETHVWIVQYQAFAKQTKPSTNAVVYGGQSGVGVVASVRIHDVTGGALLQESLIGKVNVDTESWMINVPVLSVSFQSGGAIEPYSAYKPEHYVHPSNLASPKNNSPAVKLMNYNAAVNQQGFINYAYTELKHNGTNWGDDSKVTIADNQSTKTDLNGNTVLVGTAQLCEPIGWLHQRSLPRNAGRSITRLTFREWANSIGATIEAINNMYGRTTASNLN